MSMLFVLLIVSICFSDGDTQESSPAGATGSPAGDASLSSESEVSSGSNDMNINSFDKGYKVGFVTGYQTGSSDALKNVTTNITRMFETLDIGKTPKEEIKGERSLTEIYLSLGLLLFGLILAFLQTFVVIKKGTGWERNSIRLIGLTLVLTLGAVLLPVGYSEQQVTPLMTLLGIVAGYLLAGIDLH